MHSEKRFISTPMCRHWRENYRRDEWLYEANGHASINRTARWTVAPRISADKSGKRNISLISDAPFIFERGRRCNCIHACNSRLQLVNGTATRGVTRVRAVRNGVGCVTATAATAVAAAAPARFCYSLEPSVGKQTVGIRVYGYVINVEASRNRFDITRERGWTARTAHTSAPSPVGIPSAHFPRGRIPGTSDDSQPSIG